MNKPTQDSGIPLLTEVIQTPPRAAEIPAFLMVTPPKRSEVAVADSVDLMPEATLIENETEAKSADTEAVSEPEVIASPITHAPITGWLDEEWTRMEQKISERVLAQLLDNIEAILEQRVRESLEASVQHAVSEIRQGLQRSLDQVIRDAVTQEIDKNR